MTPKRIFFRKQLSTPTLLKAIEQLSKEKGISLTIAAYQLMQFGANEYLQNKKTLFTILDIGNEVAQKKASFLLTISENNSICLKAIAI